MTNGIPVDKKRGVIFSVSGLIFKGSFFPFHKETARIPIAGNSLINNRNYYVRVRVFP
jgi:hypothetical protein